MKNYARLETRFEEFNLCKKSTLNLKVNNENGSIKINTKILHMLIPERW